MLFKKLTGITLLIAAALGACNLSSQFSAANEVALSRPALEMSPTNTLAITANPTRTAFAAPTITVLGGDDIATRPASQAQLAARTATVPPPADICSLKSAGDFDVNVRVGPGTEFKILSALPAGQYMGVIKKSANGWLQVPWGREAVGWISPKVVTLYGPCDRLSNDLATEIASPPTLTPTPTAMFGFTMNIPLNHLVTKVDVGSIPAGTTVMISTTMFTGTEYHYDIMTVDGRHETALDSQLAISKTGGTLPFPTPTPYVFVATPTAFFGNEIGMIGYHVVTTAKVGDIPAGTEVTLGSAMYNGEYWTYSIFTKDGKSAEAKQSELAYRVNDQGATATLIPVFTATAPVMSLPTGSSSSDVVIPEGMCTVTAKSVTNLVAAPNSSTVVGVLNPGPWAQVGATNGQGWYKVTIWTDGSQGWATTSTITLHGPCDTLPVE